MKCVITITMANTLFLNIYTIFILLILDQSYYLCQNHTTSSSTIPFDDEYDNFEVRDSVEHWRIDSLNKANKRFPHIYKRSRDKYNMTHPPIVVSANGTHTATIIFLHGSGDTGYPWPVTLTKLRQPYMKIVCPVANTMAVTKHRIEVEVWYKQGFRRLYWKEKEDEENIERSTKYIQSLIEEEIESGIPPERILIGGFSQGGALAILSTVTFPKKLGGLLVMSTYLPLKKNATKAFNKVNKHIPILQAHGDKDPIVPYYEGKYTSSFLKKMSKNVDFFVYDELQHTTCNEELSDIKKFFKKTLPPV